VARKTVDVQPFHTPGQVARLFRISNLSLVGFDFGLQRSGRVLVSLSLRCERLHDLTEILGVARLLGHGHAFLTTAGVWSRYLKCRRVTSLLPRSRPMYPAQVPSVVRERNLAIASSEHE
jgi:hypothetical protein